MKKLFVLSLALLLCLPLVVYAASIGGAETQGQGKFAIGLDQEFVFDKDLKTKTENYQWQVKEDTVLDVNTKLKSEIDKMYRTMAKVSYGVLDNLDVYVRLGTASFESKHSYSATASLPAEDWNGVLEEGSAKIKGDNAFAYGFGMKGTYPLKNDWFIGCDVQYLRHKNDVKETDSWTEYEYGSKGVLTGTSAHSAEAKGDVTFQEWQVAPYIAKKIGNFVPYLGGKYSGVSVSAKVKWEGDDEDAEKMKFRADDHFGVFLGTDYKLGDSWKLNIEGRFVDETAMNLGATYRF